MTLVLPPMPPPVAARPRDARGYPVPWFVQWERDGEPCDEGDEGATPIFPVMDSRKFDRALRENRCWVCGRGIGRDVRAYVVGPMCVVNRTSGEPPSHAHCAVFAGLACPFLANPARRRKPRHEGTVEAAGIAVMRNPGVAVVWITKGTKTRRDGRGGILFDIGDPQEVHWFAHGRAATRAEAEASMDSGVELLRAAARVGGTDALLELSRLHSRAKRYLPASKPEEASCARS